MTSPGGLRRFLGCAVLLLGHRPTRGMLCWHPPVPPCGLPAAGCLAPLGSRRALHSPKIDATRPSPIIQQAPGRGLRMRSKPPVAVPHGHTISISKPRLPHGRESYKGRSNYRAEPMDASIRGPPFPRDRRRFRAVSHFTPSFDIIHPPHRKAGGLPNIKTLKGVKANSRGLRMRSKPPVAVPHGHTISISKPRLPHQRQNCKGRSNSCAEPMDASIRWPPSPQ